MKPEDINNAVEVVNGLLHCLSIAKSPSAQKNILAAIQITLDCLGEDGPTRLYKDIYESQGLIPAVREYRVRCACGLKDAKDAIDKMASEHGWISPYNPSRV